MFKKMKQKSKKRKNTIQLKYQTSLEENLKKAEKIMELQDKVIALQEQNTKQKEELLEFREKEIRSLKEKKK